MSWCHAYHQSLPVCIYIPPTYECVMAYIHTYTWNWHDMSRVSSVSLCFYMYTLQIWMRHGVYTYTHILDIHAICHAYSQSFSVCMYVPHTYEWVIASINRPTWHRSNESRVCIVSLCMYVCMYVPHIYEWVMACILSCTWHREDMPYECNAVTSLTRIGLYVWYDSFMCATWLVYMYDTSRLLKIKSLFCKISSLL